MTQAANLVTFPQGTNNGIWISTYSEACLSRKSPGTIDVYQRVLRDFLLWLTERPGHASFHLDQLTRTTVEMYMTALEEAGYSVSHRTRVKSVLSSFCQWLIDEHGLLKRNPTRGLELPAQQLLAPRILSEEQRSILRTLVEQAEDLRGEAMFALGYWAGCRVSDFAHRAREVGWTLEEVAYYLGHVTKKGTPAIQTTARYTQVSREQVKEKLRYMKG